MKLNKEKEQEKVIYTIETKEYHLLTEEGLEFIVRIEDAWDWSNYYTNLSEDGKSILNSFRELHHGTNDPIIEFFYNIYEKLGELYDEGIE
jgi:hypothetical protein